MLSQAPSASSAGVAVWVGAGSLGGCRREVRGQDDEATGHFETGAVGKPALWAAGDDLQCLRRATALPGGCSLAWPSPAAPWLGWWGGMVAETSLTLPPLTTQMAQSQEMRALKCHRSPGGRGVLGKGTLARQSFCGHRAGGFFGKHKGCRYCPSGSSQGMSKWQHPRGSPVSSAPHLTVLCLRDSNILKNTEERTIL